MKKTLYSSAAALALAGTLIAPASAAEASTTAPARLTVAALSSPLQAMSLWDWIASLMPSASKVEPTPAPATPGPAKPVPTTEPSTRPAPQPTPSSPAPTADPAEPTAPAPTPSTSTASGTEVHPETEAVGEEMLRLMNDARSDAGAQPLKEVDALDTIAEQWSVAMASEGNLYHNPEFGEQVMATGTNAAAENVAMGSRPPATADELAATLFKQWMDSPGHRANIMNGDFNGIGFGVATNSKGAYYATQDFGRYN